MSSTVKAIKLLYPSLMKEDAEQQILDMLHQFEIKEQERSECAMRQRELESEIDALRKTLLDLSKLYSIEWEETEVKETPKGEAPAIVESNGTIHI